MSESETIEISMHGHHLELHELSEAYPKNNVYYLGDVSESEEVCRTILPYVQSVISSVLEHNELDGEMISVLFQDTIDESKVYAKVYIGENLFTIKRDENKEFQLTQEVL